jgi:hypothetical protein
MEILDDSIAGSAENVLLEEWVRTLPPSGMVFPNRLPDRAKYFFWQWYTPFHSKVRDTAMKLRVVRHEGRQEFLLGRIAPGQTIQEFITYCITRGYGNHFVAWQDDGELASLRFVETFDFQYHLRIFRDGEVRGHYEYTPECRPILHMLEIGHEDRRKIFYEHLGDRIVRAVDTA